MNEVSLGTRKVCKINYSFSISLPKTWIENANLNENDRVSLSMNSKKELIIRPNFGNENG